MASARSQTACVTWSINSPRGTATCRVSTKLVFLLLMGFRFEHDAIHALERLDRKLAEGGFAGQHHGIGAVIDRIGDVADLGTGRPWILSHGIEHVRRGDDRLAGQTGFQDEPFLHVGHFFQGDFDAEIAAGNHDAVEGVDDRG